MQVSERLRIEGEMASARARFLAELSGESSEEAIRTGVHAGLETLGYNHSPIGVPNVEPTFVHDDSLFEAKGVLKIFNNTVVYDASEGESE